MLKFRLGGSRRRGAISPRAAAPGSEGSTARVEALEPRRLMAVSAGFTESVFVGGVTKPTAMAFTPDGRLFVTQKDGNLRVVKNGSLLSTSFAELSVHNSGERGLLGVAIDPNFASNKYVYVFYSRANGSGGYNNRVSRLTANGDVVAAGSEKVLIDGDVLNSDTGHNGGGLHFGEDGKLYIAIGDNRQGALASQTNNLFGKVLRINSDGTIPGDNPFYTQNTDKYRAVWAYGLRNPYSFAVQPGTGRIFINDVGGAKFEEINEGKAGANYGWPDSEGPTSNPAYQTPFYSYSHNGGGEGAIAGGAFYNPATASFGADYVGDYFFGDYVLNFIKRIDPATKAVSTFVTNANLVIDIDVASDGSLYYLSREGEGRVYRVSPTTSNAPTIRVPPQGKTAPAGQPATFTVEAAGAGTLSYRWQRNGVNISGATADTYTIDAAAAADNGATFRVVVSNDAGAVTSGEAELTVVNDQAPTATITLPADGTLWAAGGQISFSGTGVDAEDGDLPAEAFTWEVVFHHDTHTHPFVAPFSGTTAETIAIPTIGETDPDIFYRIHLTVRDSAGLTHAVSRDVQPQKVNLSLRTEPAGLGLELDDQPVATPLDTPAVVGLERRLGAPDSQTVDGVTYDFASWSDGGAAVHALATPDADTVYTAVYRARVGTDPGENPGENPPLPPPPPPPPPPLPGSNLTVDAVDGIQPGVAGRSGKVKVHVSNRTDATFNAPADVELFLSLDAVLDAGDMAVATAAGRNLKLKVGATRPMAVKFTYPAVPADGDYYLLARVPGSGVTASAAPLSVRNPAVDLSGSVAEPSGGAPVARGGRATTSVTVFNTGTDLVSGPLAVSLFAVPEGDDPTAPRTELASLTKPVRINPGRSERLKLNLTVPAALAPGRYTLVALIDAAGAFTEPNETNNTALAPVLLIVT